MQRLSKTKQNLQATENKHSTPTKQAVIKQTLMIPKLVILTMMVLQWAEMH